MTRFSVLIIASAMIIMASTSAFAAGEDSPVFVPRADSGVPTIDGVWTSSDEWKKASETYVNYTDGSHLVIRAKHDGEKLYALLEMPDDYVVDGRAGICFDTLSNGGLYMKPDDYCFVLAAILKEYHGDSKSTLMYEAPLSLDVHAERGLSGQYSPYKSSKDHVTYEFVVPLKYLDNNEKEYGFYVVYETRGQTSSYTYYYSWPVHTTESSLRVASPSDWGQVIISSDVNVPEFPSPVIAVIAGVIGIVAVLSRFSSTKRSLF